MNLANNVDADTTSEQHVQAGKYEVWSLCGAIVYMGSINYHGDAFGRTACPEAVDM